MKKDKITPCGEQRLQQINAGREDHHPPKRPFKVEQMDEEQTFMIGIKIGRYKLSGLRDLSLDRAFKEPYWGPQWCLLVICKSEFEVLKFDIKHNIKFILKLNLFKGDFSFNYMFCINAINTLTLLENCNVRSQVPKRTKERREEGGEGGGRGKWRWDK